MRGRAARAEPEWGKRAEGRPEPIVEVARQRRVELQIGHGLRIGRIEARCPIK